MARINIILPTFNRTAKVIRAIASVLYQNFTDFEIIVVDDGSTDHTYQALLPFLNQIRYLSHSSNRGVSAARNTGIRASDSEYIAFLDSDDYWFPQKLEKQYDFFLSSPTALICQTEELWLRHGKRVNPWKKHLKPSADIFGVSLERCLVSPSAVMLKRCLIDEIGLFDESLPVCEDYDLWLRISCQYPVYLINEFLLIKEGGAPDQLSAQIKGMDQYRIQSIEKLLKSGRLNNKQSRMAFIEFSRKCKIYGQGCFKHGKESEGLKYLQLPDIIKKYSN
jgi:glycosyltransferase involved in cell wall biosynthesis